MNKSKVIGIDLGTTNSCVAVVEAGQPVVIQNNEGKKTTPSVVAYTSTGERKVGDSAKRQAPTNPKNTISSVKRFMGKSFSDVKSEVERASFTVESGQNNRCSIRIDNQTFTPQEISATVLQKIKESAEDYLGTSVTDAVITVPAYFNAAERQATKEAGEIAGLNVLRVINEPTAAALAYGLDKKDKDEKIIVFDLGGGTFDISVLEIAGGVFEVLSTDGDTHLGGDDFDDAIVKWVDDKFKSDNGFSVMKDPMAQQRIREAAEKAKIELSSTTQTEINLPYLSAADGIPVHFVATLTRSEFERMVQPLIDRTIACCEKAMKNAKISKNNIDEVVMVGGSIRIPAVQQAVEKYFNKKLNKSVNPDEVVAIGAAIQGAVLAGDIEDVLLLDVIPLSIGIETAGGVFTKLLEANTTIPSKKSETFSTYSDNQPSVEINILQGERAMAKDNKTLGRFHLNDIPPAPRGVPQIEVTIDVDANGIMKISAKDKATNKENSIRIEGGSSLSTEEIERMKKDAAENAENDRIEKERVETLNLMDSTIFQIDKFVNEFSDKFEGTELEDLNAHKETLKTALNNKDITAKETVEKVQTIMNAVSTRMYSQQNTSNPFPNEFPNGFGGFDGAATGNQQNSQPQDVGYEEV